MVTIYAVKGIEYTPQKLNKENLLWISGNFPEYTTKRKMPIV